MLDFVVVAQKIDKVSERRCSNGIFFSEIVCFVFVSSSLIHYVPLFPLVIALFFFYKWRKTDRDTTRRENTRKKKVQKCSTLSPSSAPAGFQGEFKRKLEKRLPRTSSSAHPPPHSPFILSHSFIHTFFLKNPAVFSRWIYLCKHSFASDSDTT